MDAILFDGLRAAVTSSPEEHPGWNDKIIHKTHNYSEHGVGAIALTLFFGGSSVCDGARWILASPCFKLQIHKFREALRCDRRDRDDDDVYFLILRIAAMIRWGGSPAQTQNNQIKDKGIRIENRDRVSSRLLGFLDYFDAWNWTCRLSCLVLFCLLSSLFFSGCRSE